MPIGWPEMMIILAVVLIIFGPGKLPDIGRSIGQSISEFRTSVHELQEGNDEPEAVDVEEPRPSQR